MLQDCRFKAEHQAEYIFKCNFHKYLNLTRSIPEQQHLEEGEAYLGGN